MGSLCNIVANVLNINIAVSKFELKLCYYIHFQTNTHGKCMNPFIPSSYGLYSIPTILLQGYLWY